jgi:pyrroline-5-carboxylate reductase
MKITFIGGGNMANALIGGLVTQGFAPEDLVVIDPSADSRARLEQTYGIRTHAGIDAHSLNCHAIVLAMKPQQLKEAVAPLQAQIGSQLVITIAAGIRLADLSRWLGGYGKLVRAMPNTPALIGAGITGLYAADGVSEAERIGAERILRAVGDTVWVDREEMIDAVTAVSGSGPAYFFHFIEALAAAGEQLGFSAEQAAKLAIGTALGAAKLAAQSDDTPAVLREKVTSKGGTTEAALRTMQEHKVRDGIVAGVIAADVRSKELGELLGKD